jgi:hypothetical protein
MHITYLGAGGLQLREGRDRKIWQLPVALKRWAADGFGRFLDSTQTGHVTWHTTPSQLCSFSAVKQIQDKLFILKNKKINFIAMCHMYK